MNAERRTINILIASSVTALWLILWFVVLGVVYIGVGFLIDPTGLMQFEHAWGSFQFGDRISVPKLSVLVFGVGMFVACVPINVYWMRREETFKNS